MNKHPVWQGAFNNLKRFYQFKMDAESASPTTDHIKLNTDRQDVCPYAIALCIQFNKP